MKNAIYFFLISQLHIFSTTLGKNIQCLTNTFPMRLDQLIWTYKGILHTTFQGLKVWDTSFLYALFVFYCLILSFENATKSAFSIKLKPKIELF